VKPKLVVISDNGDLDRLADVLIAEVKKAGISYFEGGSPTFGVRRINLSASKAHDFNAIVSRICTFPDSRMRVFDLAGNRVTFKQLRVGFQGPYDLSILRHVEEKPALTWFVSKIEVSFWADLDSQIKPPDRGVPKLKPDRVSTKQYAIFDFDRAAKTITAPTVEKTRFIDPFDHRFPIDAVYTWVDDNDQAWLESKDHWARIAGKDATSGGQSAVSARFRSRNELKYSLRSLDSFAPYFRRIHIVTAHQIPEWLDVDHPRINVVFHNRIFDGNHIPTFNSTAIGSRLHHIPDLAEHYVYFNDDVFLGCPSDPSDFFYSNGVVKYDNSNNVTDPDVVFDDVQPHTQSEINSINLLRLRFGISPSNTMKHAPHAVRKSIVHEIEALFVKEFEQCAEQKFRSTRGLKVSEILFPYYAHHLGKAVPGPKSNRYIAVNSKVLDRQLENLLKSRKYKTFCINDAQIAPDQEGTVNALVAEFLGSYFPIKSQFER
jgi:hypothetical protein